MGGFTAIELAIAFPELVERLVLVSPRGPDTYMHPRDVMTLKQIRRLSRVVRSREGQGAGRGKMAVARQTAAIRAAFGLLQSRHPLPRSHTRPVRLRVHARSRATRIRRRDGGESGLRLPRAPGEVACPTLIVWGDRERRPGARTPTSSAELIPNSRKVIFEDTGHMTMIERPAAFNALLEEFLSESARLARRGLQRATRRLRRRCRRAWRTSELRCRCVRRRAAAACRR